MSTFLAATTTPSNTPTKVPSTPAQTQSSSLTPTAHDADKQRINTIRKDENIPNGFNIKQSIGKLKLMEPRNHCLSHPASALLSDYARNGCPVDCGPNWSLEHIQHLLRRGPHVSSKHTAAIEFLRQETADKVTQGYARVVKWSDIKDCHPPQLKLSPVAMIPHKSKAFCCILDLSFGLRHRGKTLASVNSATNKKANPKSMAQLGQCIKRLVSLMAKNYNPAKPFLFSKLDIKDGFWRMAVGNNEAWNFCYVLLQQRQLLQSTTWRLSYQTAYKWAGARAPHSFAQEQKLQEISLTLSFTAMQCLIITPLRT